MARPYAQLAAVVFFIVGFAGFFTGDAGHVSGGQAGGNFDGVALHLALELRRNQEGQKGVFCL